MNGNRADTAVVVGAGSRIGKAIALELASRGFKVGIVDYGVDDARNTLDMVRRAGGTAEFYSCDIRNLAKVQAMADYFFALLGRVDLLVNNPGLDDCGRCAGDIPVDEWQEIVDTNFLGVVHTCYAFLPRMVEKGGGVIANGTYGAGIVPCADHVPYDMARSRVITFTEKLKAELSSCGIGATTLFPGLIDSKTIDAWLLEAGFDIGEKELIKG